MKRKLITKRTFVFIFVLLALALFIYLILPESKGTTFEIWIDGQLFSSHSLKEKSSFKLENGAEIVCDGTSVYFENSDCPDKVCVNTGKLSLTGQWAACLPNKTVIKIRGEEIDTVN